MGRGDLRRLAGFGASHFGRTLTWVAADVYAFYAMVANAELSPSSAGMIFFAIMVFSAVCDITVGWALDRWGTPAAGWLVGAAIISTVTLVVSLTTKSQAFMVAAAVCFRLAYALYDVPHNAMLRRLRSETTSSVTLSAIRFLTGSAASFVVAGLAASLLAANGQGLSTLAMVTALTAAVAMAIYAPTIANGRGGPATTASAGPVRALWVLVAVALLGAVLAGLLTKALAFIADLETGRGAWSGRALALLTAGRVAAAPLWAWAALRRAVLALTALAFGVVVLGGILMAAAPGSLDFSVALLGAGFGGVTVYSWALLPDLSAAFERRSGGETIHRAVAAYTALNKIALGVSGGVMSGVLASSAATHDSLTLNLGLLLAAGGFVCAGLIVGQVLWARS